MEQNEYNTKSKLIGNNKDKKLLHKKRTRGAFIEGEGKEESYETFSETHDTSFGKIINRKEINEINSKKETPISKSSIKIHRKFPSILNRRKRRIMLMRRIESENYRKKNIRKEMSNKIISLANEKKKIGKENNTSSKSQEHSNRDSPKINSRKSKSSVKGKGEKNNPFDEYHKNLEKKFGQKFENIELKLNQVIKDNKRIMKENKEKNKRLDEMNVITSLLLEIHNNEKIYSNKVDKYVMELGKHYNSILNSCRVLFVRKICDFILEGIINNYRPSLAKTKTKFQDSNDLKFNLLVFKKNTKDKFAKNLIIDYLMETKRQCSRIIHLNKFDENNLPMMKELFFLILNKTEQGKRNDYVLNCGEMANFILGNQNKDDELDIGEEKSDSIKESERINPNGEESNMNDEDLYLHKSDNEIIREVKSKIRNNDIKTSDLLNTLRAQIKHNRKKIKNINDIFNRKLGSSYFYKFWKKSFDKENYKKTKEYNKFIQRKYIVSSKEMNLQLKQLLPKYKVKFFDQDPSQLMKRIDAIIYSY